MSHTPRAQMAPPQDIVMGPPPLPPQTAQPGAGKHKEPDIAAKYSRLKRKYFELEEKQKETMLQLRSSGERNIRWRAERSLLIDRIAELELDPARNSGVKLPDPPFTAFPQCLMNNSNQQAFVANLRLAIDEIEREDPDIDPLLLSRHIGPAARKRQEAEAKERQEEESRDKRSAATRKQRVVPTKSKDIGAPLTYAPAPVHVVPPSPTTGGPGSAPSPVLMVSSTTGTRFRLKPPVHPGEGPPGSSSIPPAPHPGAQLAGIPHGHVRRRSESLSPVLSPQEDYGVIPPEGFSPSYQKGGPSDAQSQMQMTLRTSSSTGSRPSDVQRHTKPKRLKAHTVTTKSYSIPTVPRDKRGKPILPLNVGIMTVINLGEVCMREHFHTERYIFPVGYEVSRRYLSTIDPTAEVVYHSKILDGGDGPKFQIIASDTPDKPIFAGTATGAWSVIVRAANHIRNRAHSNSVSGPDFFGLGQNTIKHLIQELPHANQLKNYVWQHFTEGGPLGGRHAAVIPALPDEQDSPSPGSNSIGFFDPPHSEPAPLPVAVPASSGPQQAVLGRHGELQIIQVMGEDDPSIRPRVGPAYAHSQVNNEGGTIKPLQFHQEYPNVLPEHRGRRGSRHSNNAPSYDEYDSNAMQVDSHSPVHSRTPSRSPVMHRDRVDRDRDYYDHHSPAHQPPLPPLPHTRSQSSLSSPHHRSPYETHTLVTNGGDSAYRERDTDQSPPPPPVPATFASIMNAYPAPPNVSPPPNEGAGMDYTNGNGGTRRNGQPFMLSS